MPEDAQSRPNQGRDDARPKTGSLAVQRHSWQRAGGGPTVVGAILLVVETWLEYLVLGPGAPAVVFVLFVVAFGASTVVLLVAAFALVHYGIVGTSSGGRFALRAYGICWLLAQGSYLTYKYFLPPAISNFYAVLISSAFLGLTLLFGLASAVFIALSRIAWGPARWSLLLSIGISVVVVLLSGNDSLLTLSLLETASAAGLLFVGVTYVLAPGRDPWIGD